MSRLPAEVSFLDAVRVAGAAGKLNAIDTHFSWNDRYNLWSGLIGGAFLALAYFGTDQRQVQRYLTGKSIGQSRLSLLLSTRSQKFPCSSSFCSSVRLYSSFSCSSGPRCCSNRMSCSASRRRRISAHRGPIQSRVRDRQTAARHIKDAADAASRSAAIEQFHTAQGAFDGAREDAMKLGKERDTNYIFLTFVTQHLPIGIVGLVMAVIFTAAMSSISGEINCWRR